MVIFANSSLKDSLISPIIDCTNFTGGILKFGVWREMSFKEKLYVSLEVSSGTSVSKYVINVPTDTIARETWRLISLDLKDYIDHKPKVRIRFNPSIEFNDDGLLRIDDITLYGYTITSPTDHFRTRASGNWNDYTVWESSHDSINWFPAGLTPTIVASSVRIRNAHSVVNASPLTTVDQLTISSGGTFQLNEDIVLNDGPGDDLLVEEGGILDLSASHITTGGTIQLNGHLKTANPEGLLGSVSTSIATGISLNDPGTNSIIEYNAAGNQVISPTPLYANLVISGPGDKTLTGTTTVSNNLQINSGLLLLNEHNIFVGHTVTCAPSSFVKTCGDGKLTIRNIGPEPRTFPVGNSSYNPVVITSSDGLDWTVGVKDEWALAKPLLGTSGDKSIHRTWSVTPSVNPPAGAANVLFQYDDKDATQTGSGFNKDATIVVWRQAEDNWLIVGEPRIPVGATNVKTTTITCDKPFTLFAISNTDMPLPVRFRNVYARQKEKTVVVCFTNETENSVADYTLERSGDGQTYTPLQVMRPSKNDGTSAKYELTDASPLDGLNLYRIKGREKSGTITYSVVVRVNAKERKARITVVPNPAHRGEVSVQLTNLPQGHYKVSLYNAEGQVIQHQDLHHPGGSASFPLLIEQLAPGTYLIELRGKEKLLQRFVLL